jgi:uncharacterized protein (TIGR03435 family)
MSALADFLSTLLVVNRPVVHRTGMTKLYDFHVDLSQAAAPGANGHGASTALQELSASKGAVEILAIDHAERLPVEN